MSENEAASPDPESTEAAIEAEVEAEVEVEVTETVEIIEVVETSPADTAAIDAAVARSAEDVAVAEAIPAVEGLAALGLAEAAETAGPAEPPVEPEGWAPVQPQVAPAPGFTPEAVAQTVYVQAPVPPKPKSNRWFTTMVAAVSTVLFALLYAGAAYIYMSVVGVARDFDNFIVAPVFWGPAIAFFAGLCILGLIINKGAWWLYAVFGLLIGVLVYFSWIGFALLTRHAWTMTAAEAAEFLRQLWLSPYAIMAALIAREIPVWVGGWAARNGRKVVARNQAALEDYEREIAAGPLFH